MVGCTYLGSDLLHLLLQHLHALCQRIQLRLDDLVPKLAHLLEQAPQLSWALLGKQLKGLLTATGCSPTCCMAAVKEITCGVGGHVMGQHACTWLSIHDTQDGAWG